MKYYLSGPITGHSNYEQEFLEAERRLAAKGFEIVNPVKISRELEREKNAAPDSLPYREYMKRDLFALLECGGIIMLPGHRKSKGASAELFTARILEYEVLYYEDLVNINATAD